MRRLLWLMLCILIPVVAAGQEQAEGRDFPLYPVSKMEMLKSGVSLPAKVDNSRNDYFPEIINQYSWSCNQASSIGYVLTYELNRARNTSSELPENRYAYLYPWSFLMHRYPSGPGVSYFDTWEIVKTGGCPNVVDYPYQTSGVIWMSGYEKYYRAMFNRAFENYSMPVHTPEDLAILKRYLYDHFDGSRYGGVASFQVASGGIQVHYLGSNTPDPGAPIIMSFGSIVGHAMTIVGYDDNIGVDLNLDGEYTNDIDINGDRVVDLNDFEKGALIVVNSWGDWLTRRGKVYVAYSVLARYGYDGGFWNRSVHIPVVSRTYQPIVTMRVKLSHSRRNLLRIMAGVSDDPSANEPEHLLEFPMFNFNGGNYPLFDPEGKDTTVFELGLDLTPLTTYLEKDKAAKLFLVIDENDNNSDIGSGVIHELELYNHFGVSDSVQSDQTPLNINNNSRTLIGLTKEMHFNKIEIQAPPITYARAGDYVSVKMEATGAANPYKWELAYGYTELYHEVDFPVKEGEIIFCSSFGDLNTRIQLPFDFPFYGDMIKELIINKDGALLFDEEMEEYPYAIDENLLIRSRKRIIPFGKTIDYLTQNDKILYSATEDEAMILWEGMVPTELGSQPTKIACQLSADGTIRFYYENPEYIFTEELPILLGVSNGDNRLFKQINVSGQVNGESYNMIELRPSQLPPDIKLDASGWLFCRPHWPDHLYDIPVRVRDKFNQTAEASIYISTRDIDSAGILAQNFPNPFSSGTTIGFDVPEAAHVEMMVYDLSGRKIKELVNGELNAGPYTIEWDGTSDNGADLPSGVYICRIKSLDLVSRIRMVKFRRP